MSTDETSATAADVDELRQGVITADWLPVMAGMADWLPVLRDMAELDRAGALGGIRAVVGERLRQVRGEAQMPDDADMPYAAFDIIKGQVRLSLPERDAHLTAFAAALLAAEIDRMAGEDASTGEQASEDDDEFTPVVLAAVLTMTDGRTVTVPDLPTPKPASAGVVRLAIPYPADARWGAVEQVLIRAGTREFRRDIYPAMNLHPGNTLHLEMGLDW